MSVSINNLFHYGRPLPPPFDTLGSKKVKVSSKYGDGTTATLCGSMIKAVHAYCRCMSGSGEGAVGTIDEKKCAAEYKSSMGPDAYHLVVYDFSTGVFLASVYDKSTEVMEQYTAHSTQRDGAALLFAMLPGFMTDSEFKEKLSFYYDQMESGYPDMDKAVEAMAILCDNAYRRIKDDTCPAHVKANIDKSGNLMRISQTQLDSGVFSPGHVFAGEFTIFDRSGSAILHKAVKIIDHADFVGKYPLTAGRRLSELELSLVPKLPE